MSDPGLDSVPKKKKTNTMKDIRIVDKMRIWTIDKSIISLLNFPYLINMLWLQTYILNY